MKRCKAQRGAVRALMKHKLPGTQNHNTRCKTAHGGPCCPADYLLVRPAKPFQLLQQNCDRKIKINDIMKLFQEPPRHSGIFKSDNKHKTLNDIKSKNLSNWHPNLSIETQNLSIWEVHFRGAWSWCATGESRTYVAVDFNIVIRCQVS